MPAERPMIPVARPLLGDAEALAAARPIASGWVTQGPEVAAFEREFAELVGAKYACAVSNCTTALHLALLSAGVGPGDEVITVSHSFIATANSIGYCDATPVFVDIEIDTFNIDSTRIEAAITSRTRAILCVHQLGMPCDLASIVPIARRHGLVVIEDAACAIGSEIQWNGEWQPIGRPHGDIACFSFHPRKVITTGDGGMIATNDSDRDASYRLWRQHGMAVSDLTRSRSNDVIFEDYPVTGFNYRLTDIQAAIGREQLLRLPEIIARRRMLAERYISLLTDMPELHLPFEPTWARSNWQTFCVRLADEFDQRTVMQELLNSGVSTRRGVMCVHREAAYRSGWRCICGTPEEHRCNSGNCLGRGERAQDTGLVLPLYHQLTEADQDRVVDSLRHALQRAHEMPLGADA